MKINEEIELTVDEFKKLLETEGGVYEIESPNGWVEINEFYDRGERESVKITTESGSLKCSADHLLFNKEGEWKKAEELDVGNELRKKNSIEAITSIDKLGKVHVYDLWVNSVEHAYFSNDFISHNCGKTELAKTLAKELGIGMTKLDMSEYREEYSVSKLIGSAAGYVGYEQSGALTEPLIKMPHQVLLLDEIEKAHSSVHNLLLQVFDDGKLTDNHNREASFKNAIILMTTNVGYANASRTSATVGFVKSEKDDAKRTTAIIEESYKKTFSPEFRNRLTGVCYFHNLDEKVMGQIVDKDVRKVEDNLADKHVSIVLSPEARQWIVAKSVAEKAGGRPVERIVNEQVTERISEKLIDGDIDEKKGGTVNVSVAENGEELEIGFESN